MRQLDFFTNKKPLQKYTFFTLVLLSSGIAGSCKNRVNVASVKNIEFFDRNQPYRDQGNLPTCYSFGYLGLIENELFMKSGISIDLSERYQLLTNYIALKHRGNKARTLDSYGKILNIFGAVPESLFPYSHIADRHENFSKFTEEGEYNENYINHQIEHLEKDELLATLQQEQFFGKILSAPKYADQPIVRIPTKAIHIKNEKLVPMATVDGKKVACFTIKNEGDTKISPKKFLKDCIKITPINYKVQHMGQNQLIFKTEEIVEKELFSEASELKGASEQEQRKALCDFLKSNRIQHSLINDEIIKDHNASLNYLLERLNQKSAMIIGLDTPNQLKDIDAEIWEDRMETGLGGHAVLALGFLTLEEFKDKQEHGSGILKKDGVFDQFAKAIEADFQVGSDLFYSRMNSKLSDLLHNERGFVLIRNSYGKNTGIDGYQLIGFKYLYSRIHGVSGASTPVSFTSKKTRFIPPALWGEALSKKIRPSLEKAFSECF